MFLTEHHIYSCLCTIIHRMSIQGIHQVPILATSGTTLLYQAFMENTYGIYLAQKGCEIIILQHCITNLESHKLQNLKSAYV